MYVHECTCTACVYTMTVTRQGYHLDVIILRQQQVLRGYWSSLWTQPNMTTVFIFKNIFL